MTTLTEDCKAMARECYSTWEILDVVIFEGIEYPDAVYLVSRALDLDDEEVAEMEDRYTNCI